MSKVSSVELLKELEGWESLEVDSEKMQEIRDAQETEGRDIASLFHQAFAQNDAGKQVLDIFIKESLLKPTVTANSTQFEAGIREGRCDFVRQILLNLELAEGS